MSKSTRGLIAIVAGFAALGFALLAVFYWVAVSNPPMSFSNIDWTLKILAIAAIISFAVYLLASPDSVGKTMGKRSTRLTANALIASLVAVGIGVVLNIIIENTAAARVDWTAGKDFSLSPQTIKVLDDLGKSDKTVNAIAFFSGTDPQPAQDLLKEYAAHTARLRFEVTDPNLQPQRARQFGVVGNPDGTVSTVVFTDGDKRQIAQSVGEREFTSALVKLQQSGTQRVAFLTGHGERSITDGTTQQGYSEINNSLQLDGYETLAWSLATSPTISVNDIAVLVIADPKTAINAQEIQAIQSYLDSGGHVLMALDVVEEPQQQKRYDDMLASIDRLTSKYDVKPRAGIIADYPKRTSLAPNDPTIFGIDAYPSSSPITEDLSSKRLPVLFNGAIAILPPPPTSTITATLATTLLQSSAGGENSWLETISSDGKSNGQYDPGTNEIEGPVPLAVSIEQKDEIAASTVETNTQTPKTRLVVFGDADFASNGFVSQQARAVIPANSDLFANAVSWLAGANELISIRQKDISAPRTLILDAGQKNIQLITAVFGLPMFVLLLGGAIWWRRK
jgi:hypothetical protein